ncbi:MAG: hypothetical protein IAE79_04900 [Anaerolinea sp.]|nr:hypothetical protein [Anaerolinea sp.]
MPLTRRLILLAALVSVIAAIVLLPVPAANAQFAPADIRIGFADAFTTSEKPDELAVRVFFSLADANGKLVVDPKIAVANFAMLNAADGGPYKAEVGKAEGPIFITLVLDASGSMGRAGAALREAAIKLVDSGPQEALYSVIMFNDQLTPLTRVQEAHSGSFGRAADNLHGSDDDAAYVIL